MKLKLVATGTASIDEVPYENYTYKVTLPDGNHYAEIHWNRGHERWRIQLFEQGKPDGEQIGSYVTAEDALAWLQKERDEGAYYGER